MFKQTKLIWLSEKHFKTQKQNFYNELKCWNDLWQMSLILILTEQIKFADKVVFCFEINVSNKTKKTTDRLINDESHYLHFPVVENVDADTT